MIVFMIWSIVAVLFWGIGISSRKSTEATGFFTFVKPPAVEDAGQYNRSVGTLWIVVAVVFEIAGVPFLFLEQNSPYFLVMIFAVMFLVIGMMAAYLRIERKYRREGE